MLPVQRERQMRTTVMDLGSVAATGSVSSRNCYPVFGPLRLRRIHKMTGTSSCTGPALVIVPVPSHDDLRGLGAFGRR